MQSVKPRLVACPQCKALTEYRTDNPFRPFCSERCKLVDLGQWANEDYRIPQTSGFVDTPEDD
ncbi:MAG: DNA gyrase inhibitor YacG [Methylophilaceae bacterium]|nr:DNA gyrase inhibitor YacG [Methylophilaceae bacterium]